ncbi:MAG: leucine-rich repeat protein [Bacilli bacterium]|nr:leucine-rich repeat protein [Bacilli bacterium]
MKKLSALLLPLFVLPFLTNCAPKYYHFKFTGDHCAILGEPNYEKDIEQGATDVQFTVVPQSGYSIDYEQSSIPEGVSFEDAVITIPIMNKDYHVEVKTIVPSYHFKFTGDHCAILGEPNYEKDIEQGATDVQFTVVPQSGYSIDYEQSSIPEGVSFEDAVITIPIMNKDYHVEVKTIAEEYKYHFIFSGIHCTIRNSAGHNVTELDETIASSTSKTYQLTPEANYLLPIGEIQPGIHIDQDKKLTIDKMEKNYTVSLVAHTEDTAMDIVVNMKDNERIEFYCSGNDILIDWGDGTTNEEFGHTYRTGLIYTIQIHGVLTNFNITIMPGDDENTSITSVAIYQPLEEINSNMFANCAALETIIFPNSVQTIGEHAFDGCASLTHVVIPSSVKTIETYAFANCTTLPAITIPHGVSALKCAAFFGCERLTSLFISDTVDSIEPGLVMNCPSLTSIVVDKNNPNYSDRNCNAIFQDIGRTFLGVDIEPNSLLIVCSNTRNLDESGVKHIAPIAFAFLEGVTSIDIPEGVISIGGSAFANCFALETVHLPSTLESIGFQAFAQCISLTSIHLPNKISIISPECFLYCTNLSEVTLPDSVIEIGDLAFSQCVNLAKIKFPNSLTTIGDNAFENCSSLEEITIPPSVSSISLVNPFINCTGLTSIVVDSSNTAYRSENNTIISKKDGTLICACNGTSSIPDGVTAISRGAFCATSIENINVSPSITSIGYCAFKDCKNLKIVNLRQFSINDHVPNIGGECFSNCSDDLQFYFSDDATLNKFAETEGWAQYSDKFTTRPLPTR